MATHSSIPCLENPMDKGAWGATVHRVAKSQARLKRLGMHMFVTTLARGQEYIFFVLLDKSPSLIFNNLVKIPLP